jgi:transposase
MSARKSIDSDVLGEWEGYDIGCAARFAAGVKGPTAEVWIELHAMPGHRMCCSGCLRKCDKVHDTEERWVRDLPILDAQTHLLIQRRRVACAFCGPKVELLPWLEPYARVTTRLAAAVATLCRTLTVKDTAAYFGLGWDAVKAIHKAHLKRTLDPPDLDGITEIVMDEFALYKGHRYATVILEPKSRRVLFVGTGRDRESVRPFFEMLGKERCANIKAVGMDMAAAFAAEVNTHCPNARIVYDQFHVIAKYGREVIDPVRTAESRRPEHDREGRRLIKGSRWLLLRNLDTIKRPEDRVRLCDLLAVNRNLLTVYLLKDDLKHLWSYRSPHHARRFWTSWRARALESGLEQLDRFARRLDAFIDGIIAHAAFPLNTSILEGVNNTIKVIKRTAYGFRDLDYFFLKIRAAFPGNPG